MLPPRRGRGAGGARDLEGAGDEIAHAVPLRTQGALAEWQERLVPMPPAAVAAAIEDAALTWGGFAPEGFLTIVRPGETLSRLERMVDDAARVVRIVHALNGQWPPTTKRLAARSAELAVKPERLAERIEDALAEPEPRRALRLPADLPRVIEVLAE